MPFDSQPKLLLSSLAVIAFLSTLLTLNMRHQVQITASNSAEYSYIGDDFPPELPIEVLGRVTTMVEEDGRFRLVADPSVIAAWGTNFPKGIGFVRLGHEHRMFAISMYHELHCLVEIHQAIVSRQGPHPHFQHCLNYIRQNVLCTADLTLEPIKFTTHNFTSQPVMGQRVCNDWRAVNRLVESNFGGFVNLPQTG